MIVIPVVATVVAAIAAAYVVGIIIYDVSQFYSGVSYNWRHVVFVDLYSVAYLGLILLSVALAWRSLP